MTASNRNDDLDSHLHGERPSIAAGLLVMAANERHFRAAVLSIPRDALPGLFACTIRGAYGQGSLDRMIAQLNGGTGE